MGKNDWVQLNIKFDKRSPLDIDLLKRFERIVKMTGSYKAAIRMLLKKKSIQEQSDDR